MITATSRVAYDGIKNTVAVLTGLADGNGGSEIRQIKVDASELSPPAVPKVKRIEYCITGGSVTLFWHDANTNVPFAVLSGAGEMCFDLIGGLANAAPDPSGDILLSTQDFLPGSGYTISLEMLK
jgi:hypothetical protein